MLQHYAFIAAADVNIR